MGLTDLPSPLGVDTSIFIYFAEEHARYLSLLDPLLEQASSGQRTLVTSAITLLEVLVVPYRAGNSLLLEQYESLLTTSRGVHLVDLTRDQLHRAAQIRAATGVKTPDALQLAAAVSAGCEVFLTNDRRLPSLPGLKVLELSALVSRGLHEA